MVELCHRKNGHTVFQWNRVDYGTVSISSSNFGRKSRDKIALIAQSQSQPSQSVCCACSTASVQVMSKDCDIIIAGS